MERAHHVLRELFAQLGLPNSETEICAFITEHNISKFSELADADFWTPTQAEFIREALKQDADWSAVIDQLNNSLHN